MLNTARAFATVSLLVVLAAAAIAYCGWRLSLDPNSAFWSVAVAIGSVTGLVLLIFWIAVLKFWLRTRRAMRPDQRVSHWQVSPATWEAFRALEERFKDVEGNLPNLLNPGRKARTRPVPVIATKGAMLIDGALYYVEPLGMLAVHEVRWQGGPPECLELVMLETTMRGGGVAAISTSRRWVVLRVPAAPAQREAAVAAFTHYRHAVELGVPSNPGPLRAAVRVSLVLAVLGAIAGAVGLWMNHAGIMRGSLLPPILGITGIMVALGTLFFAGVVWALMLRRRRRSHG